MEIGRPEPSQCRDDEPKDKTNLTRHAIGALLADLCVVVRKTDHRVGQSDKQHHQHKRVVHPRPEDCRKRQGPNDQQPAHRRRTCLDKVALRSVRTDWLPLALLTTQNVDQRFPEHETKDQRREERPTRAERDVAEKVKEIAAIRQVC